MLIDQEKIQHAKEKLGDENAFLIAEILGIQDLDEQNLKACCPFHDEDTPSFVYNKKAYNYHCFGCSRSIDLIDSLLLKGKTFVEAVQYLFEKANVKFSFGEHGILTRHSYKYPKEEDKNNPMDKVYEYLALRNISKETADHCDVRATPDGADIAFNFYDTNDVLTMVKYRPARKINKSSKKPKTWCQSGADTSPILFNMNRVNTSEPLLITEGEMDAMAAIEAGYTNTVSVPLGAGNLHWIQECWDFLEQFETIIICADNDEPGMHMQKECVYRLGSYRTLVIDIPQEVTTPTGKKRAIKDLNEYLVYMGKQATLDLIVHPKETPIPSLEDFSDIEQKDVSMLDGIQIGLKDLDKNLMKLFQPSVTLLTGTPGSGKTSFLAQLICQCLDQDKGVWCFSKELPAWLLKSWISSVFAGSREMNEYFDERGAPFYRVKADAYAKMNEYYRGLLKIYRDDYPNDTESLKASMIDSARKYGSKLFILDNMAVIDLGGSHENQNELQTQWMNWLIQFSILYSVSVVLVVHPRKMQNTSEHVGGYEMAGSSNLYNLCHRSIGLKRVHRDMKAGIPKPNGDGWIRPPVPYDVMVNILKDRLLGNANIECGLFYDKASRRFYSSPEEYDHQYNWNDNPTVGEIPYPPDLLDEELFGPRGDK